VLKLCGLFEPEKELLTLEKRVGYTDEQKAMSSQFVNGAVLTKRRIYTPNALYRTSTFPV